MANRLSNESSPYLRQHADNPVDWYPWGDEAFERARSENRPVLLSIGYAACHWCHVMAHESFEDESTAALMNELFVNVKVDREERPDIDSIYMQAVQAMTGTGGWPMTVFLTPDGVPFWSGTYFPPSDRQGMPSFKRVLRAVHSAWTDKRDAVERTTEAMRDLYRNASAVEGPTGEVSMALLERAVSALEQHRDSRYGGFRGAPKFPQTMALEFLLQWHAQTGSRSALAIAHESFVAMARGGIYDQVGGGFHRYSVDEKWLVPHFEKMLYDNALLVRLGVHLWQVTGDVEVRRIVEETLVWLEREMTDADGGFYSSLDADSEGEEGKFYVWSADEFDALLGEDARVMRSYWGVTRGGNFEGHTILHVPRAPDVVAVEHDLSLEELQDIVRRSTATLYAARSQRPWPGRDEKVLASWNGLMLRAVSEAARVFGDERWRQLAERNGLFLRRLISAGRVMRVWMQGEIKVNGFLEDHAAAALAFLSLHALTLDPTWVSIAREIGGAMERHFRDPSTGAWYDTADDAVSLITRPRDVFDNATPSGPSQAVELMLWLSELDGDTTRREAAVAQLAGSAEQMVQWPTGFGHLLSAAQLALNSAVAVVLVPGSDWLEVGSSFLRATGERFHPHLLLLAGGPTDPSQKIDQTAEGLSPLPLLDGRHAIDGKTTAYLCRNFTCELPAQDAATLASQLSAS